MVTNGALILALLYFKNVKKNIHFVRSSTLNKLSNTAIQGEHSFC